MTATLAQAIFRCGITNKSRFINTVNHIVKENALAGKLECKIYFVTDEHGNSTIYDIQDSVTDEQLEEAIAELQGNGFEVSIRCEENSGPWLDIKWSPKEGDTKNMVDKKELLSFILFIAVVSAIVIGIIYTGEGPIEGVRVK